MHSLKRLLCSLQSEFSAHFKKIVRSIPQWVFENPFREACMCVTPRDALEYARRFQRMRKVVMITASDESSTRHDRAALSSALHENFPVQLNSDIVIEKALCIARLSFGSMLEDYSSLKALRICPVTTIPTNPQDVLDFSRLCMDGYFAALWTDVHSSHLVNVMHSSLERRVGSVSVKQGRSLGSPNIRSTQSVSALPSVAVQLQDSLSGKTIEPENCKNIVTLIQRCIQSGSRGWDGALESATRDEHTRAVCSKAFLSCMAGMHPQLHPAARPKWEDRVEITALMKSGHALRHMKTIMKRCTVATKECMRIYACSIMDDIPSTRAALAHADHIVGGLRSCPHGMPPMSLQAAAHCMVSAGLDLIRMHKERRVELRESFANLVALCVLENIGSEPRSRKRAQIKERDSHSIVLPSVVSGLQKLSYSSSWLNRLVHTDMSFVVERPPNRRKRQASYDDGAGTAEGDDEKTQRASAVSLINVVSECMMQCFRSVFIPWWNHAHSNDVRSARLDTAQYNELHLNSPTHMIAKHMNEDDMLMVQRAALAARNSSILCMYEVACLLNMSGSTKDALRPAVGLEDSITRLLSIEASDAASLIHFARISSMKESMVAYGLGKSARCAQVRALKRRFEVSSEEDLPNHATNVYWCMECSSVSNARVELTSKHVGHNEVGVAQTMLYVGGIGEESSIRCAKRSSAALRTALQKESNALCSRVEFIDVSESSMCRALVDSMEPSHSARLRRDIKACAAQCSHTIACGDTPMIKVNLLGRVVRVCGKWYALCSFCASIFVVAQHKRYMGGLCCGRCDAKMLECSVTSSGIKSSNGANANGKLPAGCAFSAHIPASRLPCRYCAKPPTENARFKVVRAPLDDGGRNEHIPPPLRIAAYCQTHYRNWMECASLEMNTRVIFAHISTKAVPTFGADSSKRDTDDTPRLQNRQAPSSNKVLRQLSKRMRMNRTAPHR